MESSVVSRYGGVIPAAAQGPNDSPVVALTASSESLLGERVVVRVISEKLELAERRTHEWLGLTSGDAHTVGAAMVRAVGFPEWPLLQDPENAHHALNLVSDLEWARKQARGGTGKVARRFDELAQTLSQSTPHFIPTLFEELARIFDSVGSQKYAIRYFGKAREAERNYGLDIDAQRHREVFLEFGRRGLVSAKELSLEAARCARQFDNPEDAYRYFLALNVDRVKAGTAPYVLLARDLFKLGRAAGTQSRDVALQFISATVDTPGMRKAPVKFLAALAGAVGATTITTNEELLGLFTRIPQGGDVDQWCELVRKVGALDALAQRPEQFRQWVEYSLEALEYIDDHSAHLVRIIADHAELLKDQPVRVEFRSTHIALLAALARCGVRWQWVDSIPERTRHLDLIRARIRDDDLSWDLPAILNSPEVCERVIFGHALEDVLCNYAHGLHKHGLSELVFFFMRRELTALETGALLPGLQRVGQWLGNVRSMDLPADLREYMERITDVDEAELLAENLKAGLVTEFTWPALEAWVHERLSTTSPNGGARGNIRFYPSYPGVVAFWNNQCAAVAGDQVLREHTFNVGNSLLLGQYFGDDHAILHISEKRFSSGTLGEWSSGATMKVTNESYYWSAEHRWVDSVPWAGGRLLPSGMIRHEQSALTLVDAHIFSAAYADRIPSGQVFSTSDGRAWRWESVAETFAPAHCYLVDPVDGRTMGAALPPYVADAVADGVPIVPSLSTVLAAPHRSEASIVPTNEGNIVCLVGNRPDERLHTFVRLGDGTEYAADTCLVGVIQAAGMTRLVGSDGQLYVPNTLSSIGQLARTCTDRGHEHWLHHLPWTAWANLQVRSSEASRRLRNITPTQARLILDSLDNSPLKRPKYRTSRNVKTENYGPIHPNCTPDSQAMTTVAEVLGCADHDLCASVVQLAMETRSVAKRYLRNHKFFVGKHQRAKQQQDTQTPQAAQSAASRSKFLAVRECEQLAGVVHKRAGTRAKRWLWMHVIGNEKPFLLWASGPLASAAQRASMVECMRVALHHELIDEHWCQVFVNWQQFSGKYGKSYMGLTFPLAPELEAILVQRGQKTMRGLVRGRPSQSFPDVEVECPTHQAAAYGVTLAMSPEGVTEWLTHHETVREFDAVAWLAEHQPLIDAISQHCALTPRAATVLLAGGFLPNMNHVRLFTDGSDKHWAPSPLSEEEAAVFQQRLKALKLTKKAYNNAIKQLEVVDGELLELVLAAAFDRDLEALAAIAAELPQTKVPLSDAELDVFFSWTDYYSDEIFAVLCRAASPLPPKTRLKGGYGYGLLAGAILYWATRAETNDPLRGFFADQIEALKTIPDDALSNEWPTTLPLQGKIGEADQDGYVWLNSVYHADAIRGVKEGLFDSLIAALRRPDSAGGCVMDPRVVAPDTVASVQDSLGISESAATYFLQVLCLVECTDRNVKEWNGWKKKDLDQARAELVAAGHVVEAKRSRAGRTAFLPGVWLEASHPNTPMEEWKVPYYLVRYNPKVFAVVPWCPPVLPTDELFAAAWERYLSGDVPRYEELTTQRYRKRR